jgi:hypothetical protein
LLGLNLTAFDPERSLQLRRSTGIPALPNVKTACLRRGIVPLTRQDCLEFNNEYGAGEHTHVGAISLSNAYIFNWLDSRLGGRS